MPDQSRALEKVVIQLDVVTETEDISSSWFNLKEAEW
jgi:hypothetical protein